MALELAKHNSVYEDIASKFFEVSQSIVVTLDFVSSARVAYLSSVFDAFTSNSISFSSPMP
jgi:hypothetical protein